MTGIDQTTFAAARLMAVDLQPFLSAPLFALTPVAAPGLGTFAVDRKWRLFIDPDTLEEWGAQLAAGVLLHEVAHVVRDHVGRAEDLGVGVADALRWNVAADIEINDSLQRDGVELPRPRVDSRSVRRPANRVAEYYFDALTDRRDLPDPGCTDGAGFHDHAGPDGPSPTIGASLPDGVDDVEADLIRHQVAVAILAEGARPGDEPGSWERWARSIVDPVLPWEQLLRASIRSGIAAVAGSADYSYSRPSRRTLPDVVLPRMVRPLPTVAVIIDTSGSMGDAQLDAAWSETLGCLRALGVRRDLLHVFATDTEAHAIRTTGSTAALVGGGGTDMGVGIDAALQVRPQPNVVVVLTDGFTPWPVRRPAPASFVVGLVTDPSWPASPEPPDWCDTTVIPASPAA